MAEQNENQRVSVPNVWGLTSEHNPYLHNVFALMGLDPDDVGKIESEANKIGMRIESEEIVAHGKKIAATDVSRVTQLKAKENEFVAERLLAHTAHQIDSRKFAKEMREIESIGFDNPTDFMPLQIKDLSVLVRLMPAPGEVDPGDAEPVDQSTVEEILRPKQSSEHLYDI